jgi:hypothetical protein
LLRSRGGIRLTEGLEQARKHLGRHPHSRVRYLDHRSLLRRFRADGDPRGATPAGELGRVLQQIADDLRHAIPVDVDEHGRRGGIEFEAHLSPVKERALILDGVSCTRSLSSSVSR